MEFELNDFAHAVRRSAQEAELGDRFALTERLLDLDASLSAENDARSDAWLRCVKEFHDE